MSNEHDSQEPMAMEDENEEEVLGEEEQKRYDEKKNEIKKFLPTLELLMQKFTQDGICFKKLTMLYNVFNNHKRSLSYASLLQCEKLLERLNKILKSGELSVVNVSGTNTMGDQVRTAVVKKHAPAVNNGSCVQIQSDHDNQVPEQRLHHPPPYHIAATFSKQASFFQDETYVNKEVRRSDIDTAQSTLKVELINNPPQNDCRLSLSEQSESVEQIYPVSTHNENCVHQYSIANSDVDSAFVDNIETNYKAVEPINDDKNVISSEQFENDGTYSAFPGIVITENSSAEPLPSESGDCLPYDSSNYPISKVNSWLISRTKSPVTPENGCEFINMYPCENNEQFQSESNQSNQESNSPIAVIGKRQEELITSSKITKPSKLPGLFEVDRNPQVVEVTIEKMGPDLKCNFAVLDSGIFVKSVSEDCQVLKKGDKILQIDGVDIKSYKDVPHVISSLKKLGSPFTMMISG